jgi:5'-3' exonuclease
MDIYLIDGTYELFRHYFAVPSARDRDGREVGAVRGVVTSLLGMMTAGTTHIGVATDHVIESFRNQMWPGYKTGAGIEPDLLAQFPLLEDTLYALGVAVWPMVEYEADDALASAAAKAAADPRVERVLICTPDKDLAQCVRGTRIVQMDRRARTTRDEAGVVAKFGVPPASIPDYLALVGDSADGFPGLPGWGAKSAAAVLDRWGHLEQIPADPLEWDAGVRSAAKLNATLREQFELALLFRRIATVETDADVGRVAAWRWAGPTDDFPTVVASLGDDRLLERATRLVARLDHP